MGWKDIDLSMFKVAAAPYGGPIALIRDDSKSMRTTSTKPMIYIYSASGRHISDIRWNSGHVIHLGWSSNEDLLCVQDDGSVLVYDIFGVFKRTFSMGQEAKDMKVLDCRIFRSHSGTGLAILTNSFKLFVVNNIEEPRIRKMAEVPGLSCPPSSWAVISEDRQSRILLAKESELYLLDHGGQYSQEAPPMTAEVNSFIEMSVSFNNKYLALFTDSGLFWIGSADLQKVYCEFNTKSPSKPQQLVWCGTGAIVAYWENLLLMVGPDKDWVKYNMDSTVHLVPELDGLRIVGRYTHDFLQRVPNMVEDVFKIGSMAPGAMLYEASREFQKGSQKADEYIRMIKDKLQLAVEQCIVAAGAEYEPNTQRMLLRAASFGKCFLSDMRPEPFFNMCQMLRVLNAVRDYRVGIPLTYSQLEHLRLAVLIDRLILRREWCLAIRICKYLKMAESEGESRILAHWACYKVQQTNRDDEQIARAIQGKLGDTPGISYTEIAAKASECGRTELAIRQTEEQVKLMRYQKRLEEELQKPYLDLSLHDTMFQLLLHRNTKLVEQLRKEFKVPDK
ncbi:vacuolar protein sorting-associated protein 16 homolog, partial [Saccoglossus kowalevskii]